MTRTVDLYAIKKAIADEAGSIAMQRAAGLGTSLFTGTYSGRVYTKARHRFAGVRAYTPANTARFEKSVKAWFDALKFGDPLHMPIAMYITIFDERAKGMPDVERMLADAKIHFASVGDLADNLIKAVLDALNGRLYTDDSQIVYCESKRQYSSEPGFVIEVDRAGLSKTEIHNLKNRLIDVENKWWVRK
jgi:Holliday junction resolvase RusA-like endonuclease